MERILALATLGAPQRRMLRNRRGRAVQRAEPEPVPTSRVTVISPEPFGDEAAAAAWLADIRSASERLDDEVAEAVSVLNRALRAHRAARADPAARDVTRDSALVVRVGYGAGDAVAEGRFAECWELPVSARRRRRSMEAPDERFAALLGGREPPLACEELVLRAIADVDAGRDREAALQARIALETLLAELTTLPGMRRAPLEEDRGPVGAAANAALAGELDPASRAAVRDAVGRMEAALRAHRVGAGG